MFKRQNGLIQIFQIKQGQGQGQGNGLQLFQWHYLMANKKSINVCIVFIFILE